QDFTWLFWGNQPAENTQPNNVIFGNRYEEVNQDCSPRQFIKFTPTKFEWHMNGNGNDNLEYDDLSLDAGVWLHHAVVKDGATITYYRNGQEANARQISQPLDFPQPLFLGGIDIQSDGENWQGMMSDARIYDEALSASDVESCFLGSCPGDGVPGDVNGDGVADLDDFEIISGNFGLSPATREEGNLRSPDRVDLEDFRAWKSGAAASGGADPLAAAVPEPASLALACLALTLAKVIRRESRR
ncbi:MAG: LamG domain-containing protein, partial [Planctomycetota bacterium]